MRTPTATVRDLCVREVVTISHHATLSDCAQRMRQEHVGSLVVLDDRGSPCGMVTDRDVVIEAVAPGLDTNTVTAGDVMSQPLASVREDEDIQDALARMREHGVRRLAVLNEAQQLTGIVSIENLLESLAEQLDCVMRVMKSERTREATLRA